MKTPFKTSSKTSHRIGAMFGKAWRGWLRLENRFALWIKKIGVPVTATKITLRLLLVAGLVAILFATGVVSLLWAIVQILVMIILVVLILANWPSWLGEVLEEKPSPSYFPEDEDDHRNQPGYDPHFYPEDDPDPRFRK
ncbi:hypothetical protein CUZ56_00210 [Saezia sanguinis]|uniref:DUF3742 family protein n=1 Tax=Saezia sanguinis TaxID=1965230 RepID=A0A433SG65_9BURK|nr:DUF3742 family protein [Saezia sanguinis]RUS67733.1 hypothetical protein CUZ56_00210 [Saezia sanguinis]